MGFFGSLKEAYESVNDRYQKLNKQYQDIKYDPKKIFTRENFRTSAKIFTGDTFTSFGGKTRVNKIIVKINEATKLSRISILYYLLLSEYPNDVEKNQANNVKQLFNNIRMKEFPTASQVHLGNKDVINYFNFMVGDLKVANIVSYILEKMSLDKPADYSIYGIRPTKINIIESLLLFNTAIDGNKSQFVEEVKKIVHDAPTMFDLTTKINDASVANKEGEQTSVQYCKMAYVHDELFDYFVKPFIYTDNVMFEKKDNNGNVVAREYLNRLQKLYLLIDPKQMVFTDYKIEVVKPNCPNNNPLYTTYHMIMYNNMAQICVEQTRKNLPKIRICGLDEYLDKYFTDEINGGQPGKTSYIYSDEMKHFANILIMSETIKRSGEIMKYILIEIRKKKLIGQLSGVNKMIENITQCLDVYDNNGVKNDSCSILDIGISPSSTIPIGKIIREQFVEIKNGVRKDYYPVYKEQIITGFGQHKTKIPFFRGGKTTKKNHKRRVKKSSTTRRRCQHQRRRRHTKKTLKTA